MPASAPRPDLRPPPSTVPRNDLAPSAHRMNASLISLELATAGLGLLVLLADLWLPAEKKRGLGYVAAAALALIFVWSLRLDAATAQFAFEQTYVLDSLALFFKRFFLLAAVLVMLLSIEFSDRIKAGI